MDSFVPKAASRVFAIPELLEAILIEAAKPDRVEISPEWSVEDDLAACEKQAQGMNFILTSAMRVNRTWNTIITSSPTIQELIFLRYRGGEMITTFNPLLVTKFTWAYFHQETSKFGTPEFRRAVVYSKASWRNMFPVLPPIRKSTTLKEEFTSYWIYCTPGSVPLEALPANDGLRMGFLFDIVEFWHGEANAQSVELTWQGRMDVDEAMEGVLALIPGGSGNYKAGMPGAVLDFASASVVYKSTHLRVPISAMMDVFIYFADRHPSKPGSGSGETWPKMESEGKQHCWGDIVWGETYWDK